MSDSEPPMDPNAQPPGYNGPPPGYGPQPPGYGAPTPGWSGPPGYPQPGGYGGPPPGWSPQPPTPITAILAHAGAFVGGFLLPLVLWIISKDGRDAYARHHAAEALNFQLTVLVAIFGSIFVGGGIALVFRNELSIIGFVVAYLALIAISIANVIITIIAMIHASRWEWWRYPLCIRFVDKNVVPPV